MAVHLETLVILPMTLTRVGRVGAEQLMASEAKASQVCFAIMADAAEQ